MARSHSSATIAPSKKLAANAMTASDPDLAKQLYKANVKVAIDDRISGSSSKYDELCDKFTSPDSSAIELSQYLAALTHFVTYLPHMKLSLICSRLEAPQFTSLVRAIVSLNWLAYPPALLQVYVQFLGSLATAQTTYLPMMLKQLLAELAETAPSPNAMRTDLQLNAHWAIQHLLDVVPSGSSILHRLIRELFPHPTADRREQISYVFNLIRMGHYAENLKGEILSLCVQRAVQIDVCPDLHSSDNRFKFSLSWIDWTMILKRSSFGVNLRALSIPPKMISTRNPPISTTQQKHLLVSWTLIPL